MYTYINDVNDVFFVLDIYTCLCIFYVEYILTL